MISWHRVRRHVLLQCERKFTNLRYRTACFENYLTGKTPADEMRAVSRALDWLQSYDQFSKRLYTERDYDILPYIPFTFVAWNPLFAAVANKTPEWPRIDYEVSKHSEAQL
jgi:hypothetical protein